MCRQSRHGPDSSRVGARPTSAQHRTAAKCRPRLSAEALGGAGRGGAACGLRQHCGRRQSAYPGPCSHQVAGRRRVSRAARPCRPSPPALAALWQAPPRVRRRRRAARRLRVSAPESGCKPWAENPEARSLRPGGVQLYKLAPPRAPRSGLEGARPGWRAAGSARRSPRRAPSYLGAVSERSWSDLGAGRRGPPGRRRATGLRRSGVRGPQGAAWRPCGPGRPP